MKIPEIPLCVKKISIGVILILTAVSLSSEISNLSLIMSLTENSMLVAVTIIYVIINYFILQETQNTVKQNQKNIELTLNAQNMLLIQKKLENFYYPLYNFLKTGVHIQEPDRSKCKDALPSINYTICLDGSTFYKIMSCQYLADDDTKDIFNRLIYKFYKSCSSTDQEAIIIYSDLMNSLDSDILMLNQTFQKYAKMYK